MYADIHQKERADRQNANRRQTYNRQTSTAVIYSADKQQQMTDSRQTTQEQPTVCKQTKDKRQLVARQETDRK